MALQVGPLDLGPACNPHGLHNYGEARDRYAAIQAFQAEAAARLPKPTEAERRFFVNAFEFKLADIRMEVAERLIRQMFKENTFRGFGPLVKVDPDQPPYRVSWRARYEPRQYHAQE